MPELIEIRREDAISAFFGSRPLRDASVAGGVKILMDSFDGNIQCENCRFESFATTCTHVSETVRFTNCEFDCLDFYSTYFFNGLIMDRCKVNGPFTFQSGGHNNNQPILCLLYTSPSPRDATLSRMPSSA